MSAYVVETDAFSGPLDLLLQLITRHQVDIYDIPLRCIVDDYVAEVVRMESLDLEVATGFLLVAATLIELKTVALLPDPDDVDLDDELALWEERDLLISRLLQAKTFSDVSRVLEVRLEEGAGYQPREAGLEEPFLHLVPDLLAQVDADHLCAIAESVLAERPQPHVDVSHLTPIRVSVRDAMATLARRLPGKGVRALPELAAGATSRLEVIVVLLGVLELFKQGFVRIHQATTFGTLSVSWCGPADGRLPDWSGASAWDEPSDDGSVDPEVHP